MVFSTGYQTLIWTTFGMNLALMLYGIANVAFVLVHGQFRVEMRTIAFIAAEGALACKL
jgi:hypothetical protein